MFYTLDVLGVPCHTGDKNKTPAYHTGDKITPPPPLTRGGKYNAPPRRNCKAGFVPTMEFESKNTPSDARAYGNISRRDNISKKPPPFSSCVLPPTRHVWGKVCSKYRSQGCVLFIHPCDTVYPTKQHARSRFFAYGRRTRAPKTIPPTPPPSTRERRWETLTSAVHLS